MKIDRDDEDVQMDVEVDVEELKYNAEEMRKKLQTLKSTLRELRKSKNGRANPALIEQREQTLNDFKNKVRLTIIQTNVIDRVPLGAGRSTKLERACYWHSIVDRKDQRSEQHCIRK